MATVRLCKREKSWYVDYTVGGKRKRESVSKDKKRAMLIAATIQSNLDKGKYGLPLDVIELPLQDLIMDFLNSKRHRVQATTMNRYREYLDHFVGFLSGTFPTKKFAHEIKSVYIQECLQPYLDSGGAAKTANEELALIKQMFSFAKSRNRILINPVASIGRFPASPVRAVEFFTHEQVDSILEHSPDQWRDVFEFFYLTGLRNAELINLTWHNVDLQNKQIKIQSSTTWRTKTGGFRIVPLNVKAVKILERRSSYDEHDYVFTNEKGKKIPRGQPYKVLRRVLKKLGLEGNIHKLRHTSASPCNEG